MTRFTRTAVVVCAGALALAGCTTDPGRADEAARAEAPADLVDVDLVASAVDQVADASTARVEMVMTYEGIPGIDGASITAEGEIDDERGASRFVMDMGSLFDQLDSPGLFGFSDQTEMIVIGSEMYQRSDLFSLLPGLDDQWIVMDLEELAGQAGVDGSLDALAQGQAANPHAFLDQLRAIADVEEVGEDEVRGVPTRHLRGQVHLEDALDELDADAREALGSFYGGDLGDLGEAVVPIDVYVDDDGFVRRVEQRVAFDQFAGLVDGAGQPEAEDLSGVALNLSMDYFDFGAEVSIEAPEGAVSFEELFSASFEELSESVGELEGALDAFAGELSAD